MSKTFYEKQGDEFVPVSEYNSDLMDSLTEGAHLIMCYPGGCTKVHNIDPDYAGLIAASYVAREAMCDAIFEANQFKPARVPLTKRQKDAWDKFNKEMGDDICMLQHSSIFDIADAGVKALQKQAHMLYCNPAVRIAYEQFILVCELAKETNNDA